MPSLIEADLRHFWHGKCAVMLYISLYMLNQHAVFVSSTTQNDIEYARVAILNQRKCTPSDARQDSLYVRHDGQITTSSGYYSTR
jgi:hypothetical protein